MEICYNNKLSSHYPYRSFALKRLERILTRLSITMSSATLQVMCCGEPEMLRRPCVDCGRITGSFCELECSAPLRIPTEKWVDGQITPHCTICDGLYGCCHFCRGQRWAQPPPWPAEDIAKGKACQFRARACHSANPHVAMR